MASGIGVLLGGDKIELEASTAMACPKGGGRLEWVTYRAVVVDDDGWPPFELVLSKAPPIHKALGWYASFQPTTSWQTPSWHVEGIDTAQNAVDLLYGKLSDEMKTCLG